MANGEFIDLLSPSAIADIKAYVAEIEKGASAVDKINASLKGVRMPSENKGVMQQVTNEIKRTDAQRDRSIKIIERNRLAEIKLQQDREKAFAKYEVSLAKENASLARNESLYNKVQQKVNSLASTYNNIAIKKELGIRLNDREIAQLSSLEGRLNRYQSALKNVDANIQRHTRNVGNYTSGWNGLGNSINQITRELPAFTFGAQTGFLALSNNIPILTDEIGNLTRKNKELVASGEPVKSVLSQILSGVFSLQTAMGVGILLVTVYGREIGALVSKLLNVETALNRTTQAQLDFNDSVTAGTKNEFNEALELQKLQSAVKNTSLSMERRNIAYDKLMKLYPRYFSESERQIALDGNMTKKQVELYTALEKSNQAKTKQSQIETLGGQIIDIENEITARENYEKALRDNFNTLSDLKGLRFRTSDPNQLKAINETIKEVEAERLLIKAKEDSRKERRDEIEGNENLSKSTANLKKEVLELYSVRRGQVRQLNELYAQSILLEDQDKKSNKTKREKIALNFKEVESEFALKMAILERQKAQASDRMTNQDSNLDAIILARQEFSEKSIEILNLETQKEQAILSLRYADDLAKNNLALKNKDISFEQHSQNILDINNRYKNEIATSDLVASRKFNDLLNSDQEFYRNIEKEKRDFSIKTNEIILNAEQKKYKKIADDETKTLDLRQKAFREYLRFARKELDIQKIRALAASKSKEETESIIANFKALNDSLDEEKSPYDKAREDFEKYLLTLSSGTLQKQLDDIGFSSLKMFADIDKNGQTTFMKLMDLANGSAEEFAVAFKAIGDVVIDTFNFINRMAQENFDRQVERLGKERDVALMFAGESATAREEIERQYDERRKQIERQRVKQQKESAIFSAIINTAQGVVAALANPGGPAGVALAVAVGAIGAAQIALIASQQVPAYAEGTDNHAGGLAIVGDGGKREIVYQPSKGLSVTPKTDTLVDLEKGSKVFPDFNSFLRNSGSLLGGIPNIELESKGASASEIDGIMGKYFKNIQTNSVTFDKNGIAIYSVKQGQKTVNANNRASAKGYTV